MSRSLDGEDVDELTAVHNNVFFLVTDGWLPIYEGQYPILGDARIMSAKAIWDTGVYWAVPALLYFHDQLTSLIDNPGTVAQLARMSSITVPVQRFFREWYETGAGQYSDDFIAYYDFDFMSLFHSRMADTLSGDEFSVQLAANLDRLEQLAGQMVASVTAEYDFAGDSALCAQAERWKADKKLQRLVQTYQRCEADSGDTKNWLHQLPAPVTGASLDS